MTKRHRLGWIDSSIGYIPLTRGKVAVVDPEDVERLQEHKWYTSGTLESGKFYAARAVMDPETKKIKGFFMHRELLGLNPADKVLVDHANHNTLDNRKENLRLASRCQNGYNTRVSRRNKSGFKGVTKIKEGKFQSSIKFEGKNIWIGYFDTAEEASEAYAKAAHELHREFACLG